MEKLQKHLCLFVVFYVAQDMIVCVCVNELLSVPQSYSGRLMKLLERWILECLGGNICLGQKMKTLPVVSVRSRQKIICRDLKELEKSWERGTFAGLAPYRTTVLTPLLMSW